VPDERREDVASRPRTVTLRTQGPGERKEMSLLTTDSGDLHSSPTSLSNTVVKTLRLDTMIPIRLILYFPGLHSFPTDRSWYLRVP